MKNKIKSFIEGLSFAISFLYGAFVVPKIILMDLPRMDLPLAGERLFSDCLILILCAGRFIVECCPSTKE
ncbi:MAG: hypothetical protein IKD28_01675 [Clostridia bacterium]|nr:hypothetical protein [Clostridia bacterium]